MTGTGELIEAAANTTPAKVPDFGENFEEAYNKMVEDVGIEAANQIKAVAAKVVENLDPARQGSEVTLMFGRIQSGKTGALTQSLALARDNGFRIFIVLTMDNEALYEQTATRLQDAFPLLGFITKDKIKPAKNKDAKVALEDEAKGTGPGLVLFLSKNSTILDHAYNLLRKAKVADVPAVIFDDEADQASLNGNAIQKLKGDEDSEKIAKELTKVHKNIQKIRHYLKFNAFVAVTATPQALFLQQEGALHRPKHHVVIPTGNGYQGGEYFMIERPGDLHRPVADSEVREYISGSKLIKKAALPEGMRAAVATFFVGAAFGIANDKAESRTRDRYSMLIHISARQGDHDRIVEGVTKYAKLVKEKLEGEDIPKEIVAAYEDMVATTSAAGRTVPDFETVSKTIQSFAPPAQIMAVNAKNTGQMDFTKPEKYRPFNIFIGGNVLGRGITIRGLITTYYGRDPAKPHTDTVIQHARWYGYRRKLEPYIRVFAPEPVWTRFLQLHNHDDALREAALSYIKEEKSIVPLWVPGSLKPTRRNVLEPGSLGTYAGGVTVYQKLPDAPRACKATSAIDKFLLSKMESIPGATKRSVCFISVDEAKEILDLLPSSPHAVSGTWHTASVKGSLDALSNVLKHKRVRIVWGGTMERGRSRATPFPYHINSFIASAKAGEKSIDQQHVDEPERFDPPGEPPTAPTLYLFRIDKNSGVGEDGVGWGDPTTPGSTMTGKPAPEDFYVPGFHPPALINNEGYGIVFALP